MYLDQGETTCPSTFSHICAPVDATTKSVKTRRNHGISFIQAYQPCSIISLTVLLPNQVKLVY